MSTELEQKLDTLTDADYARGLEVFRGGLKEAEASYLNACVRCGLCAGGCHYHRTEPELENVPGRKLDHIASVFKAHFTTMGRLAPGLVGAKRFDRDMARAWVDAVFGRCTLCGRCSMNCTIGIPLPALFRAARRALGAMGLVPEDLQATVENSLQHGNNMAIEREEWVETVEWMEEELQADTGDPEARIPLDKQGARCLFTVNPREAKFFPLSLQASAKVFWAAGEDWTLASDGGWDLTNYALFTCEDDQAAAIVKNLTDAMTRLGCQVLVIGECGHGYQSARWMGPEWLKQRFPFPVVSILELMDGYLNEGRIHVDSARNQEPVTLHDPCNLVRHGGISEPQRRVLRRAVANLVEMAPHGVENYCCGGGGGQLAMSRYRNRRLAAGKKKADQIRATGAKVVAAPCHNCIDQLSELNKEYQLKVQIKTVAELVAAALIVPTHSEVLP
ncbi:MAG: (Fe-S)-binding protein [Acidobacteria bacterium]|nr:(Fe-S)-binding protein [Acidobacteriota bacterium]MBI3489724.1 (Fe-S)-binding protein [Acidobacteriota bacterium]